MDDDKIMVSIDCLAYNHGPYIADAIESFLAQKTDFDFEILIHEDASTDGTAEIIRGYEKRYPEIIKVIYQTENQYSQGIQVHLINHKRAKGKYHAICEGDDYWTDPYKLQKQVDYMERDPDCSMCVHAAFRVAADTKKVIADDRPSRKDKIFTTPEIISGGGRLFATSSVMYAREKIREHPDFFLNSAIGDYPLAIYASLQGRVYYMDDNMSVYRVGVDGSWTDREFSTTEKIVKHYRNIGRMLDEFNEYTSFLYDSTVSDVKKSNEVHLLMESGRFKEAKDDAYIEFYKNTGIKKRVAARIKFYFPVFSRFLKKARNTFSQYVPGKKAVMR